MTDDDERFDELVADLNGEFVAQQRRELWDEVADRTRGERTELSLAARLHACVGCAIRLVLPNTEQLAGRLTDVGAGWIAVTTRETGRATEAIVPWSAIRGIRGVQRAVRGERSAIADRRRLTVKLRELSRARRIVSLVLQDAAPVAGTMDAVGHDFVDMVEHSAGERPSTARGSALTVPLAAIVVVRILG